MKLVDRIKWLLLAETIFIVLVLGLAEENVLSEGLLVAAGVFQMVFMLLVITLVLIPFRGFRDALESMIDAPDIEEQFWETPRNVPFMDRVFVLLEKYAASRTRENTAQIFNKQTELTALQSQINPHFLYNTLETIRGQALIDDNDEIARMVEALSAFFRYSISRKGNLVTLRDELKNIENYMTIQRYRFNNRFSLEVVIDEEDEIAYDFLIPRLIIQPVVENAIFHGLEEKLEGGIVAIEIIVTEQNLIITISDNGVGIEADKLKELNRRIHSRSTELEDGETQNQKSTGIALPNIHKRIRLLFGEEYGVNVYSTLEQGTDVEITIPANYENDRGLEDEEGNAKSK